MVMFPGWVNHSVPKHIGEDRIVVAGNLTINPFSHLQTFVGSTAELQKMLKKK
jgi:hypothetical protein